MGVNNFLRTFSQRKGADIGWSKTCCWIEGERPYGDSPFCDAVSIENSSYCAPHHARAWRLSTPRKAGVFVFKNGSVK